MVKSQIPNSKFQKYSIFFRLISTSLRRRKSRGAILLLAVILGAALISGLVNIYSDIGSKMSREFRSYGANLVLVPKKGNFILGRDVRKATQSLNKKELVGAAPYIYGVVQVRSFDPSTLRPDSGQASSRQVQDRSEEPPKSLVAVGTWFDQVRKVNPYWKLKGKWPRSGEEEAVLVGEEAAKILELERGDTFKLLSKGKESKEVVAKGIVRSGGVEENQIFIDLKVAQELLGYSGKVNVAYFSLVGQEKVLQKIARDLEREFPQLMVEPVRKISRSEGLVLEKIRYLVYLVSMVVLLTITLCIITTMIALAIERRQEVALKKALGASNLKILLEFFGEGAILGVAGGIIGWFLGFFFAQFVGTTLFGSLISFRIVSIFAALLISLVVAILASVVPVRIAMEVQPAVVLKGE